MKKRITALLLALALVLSVAAASAATYYRVNTSHLKVHQFDDEKSQVVASREKDFAMTVVKKVGNWRYVKFTNGNEGYVQKKYVTSNSSYSAWVDADGTNLRKGPGYDYANVGTLAKGAKVTVLTSGSTRLPVLAYITLARSTLSNPSAFAYSFVTPISRKLTPTAAPSASRKPLRTCGVNSIWKDFTIMQGHRI